MPTLTINNTSGKTTRIDIQPGQNLYSALISAQIELNAPCGGRCFCGKCKIRVSDDSSGIGAVNEPLPAELDLLTPSEIAAGYRLACAVTVNGDITVTSEASAQAQIMLDGESGQYTVEPSVEIFNISVSAPDLSDQRGDIERVSDTVPDMMFSLSAARELPGALRAGKPGASLVAYIADKNPLVLSAKPKDSSPHMYGLAVDIGTTTIVSYLMDLRSGAQLDVRSALNPQRNFGADVVSRTDYVSQGCAELAELQKIVADEISRMAADMTIGLGVSVGDIYHAVFVGNTVMMHILAGIPPKNIAVSPFIPVYTEAITLPAEALGISLPSAVVTLAPCVSGYVGADTIAAIMASGMDKSAEISLLVDIGTNGEIALGGSGRMLACSTAAGPAFEGAHIRNGTGGVAGAVNKVYLDGNSVSHTTIGNLAPIGICGSGLVDAVALMKSIEVMDEMGRITESPDYRFADIDGKPAFVICGEGDNQIVICQRDLREVQLAKGAIAAGIAVLMKEMSVDFGDINNVYLAGGFGNYIDFDSACKIGLLPSQLRSKIHGIGNGAGAGAKKLLLSQTSLINASKLRSKIEYLELSSRADFQDLFVDNMLFE